MAITITLIIVAMIALATFELWLFWTLGEREDARRRAEVRRHAVRGDDAAAGDRHLTKPGPRAGDNDRSGRASVDRRLGRRGPQRAAR